MMIGSKRKAMACRLTAVKQPFCSPLAVSSTSFDFTESTKVGLMSNSNTTSARLIGDRLNLDGLDLFATTVQRLESGGEQQLWRVSLTALGPSCP